MIITMAMELVKGNEYIVVDNLQRYGELIDDGYLPV